ncbi:Uma2 family endonuclease, partial [Kitasatospora sp. NRRL B-11411]|uniref:Uma2 family endonuclease n=1 Tax=Kitasatospora sp. NRRL B-11411 TaxID=1463822 RepID=UPI0004C3D4A6
MGTEPIDWMQPPVGGWTFDQANELDLPFKWELVDGTIVARGRTIAVKGQTPWWHDRVRDRLLVELLAAGSGPYDVSAERAVLLDGRGVVLPDLVVFDGTGLQVGELLCTPVESVVLAIEVVSPGSRVADRFTKPGLYAEKGVPSYWRVERGDDDVPVVHEFRLDREQGVYLPVAVHEGSLRTELPFPVEIDLKRFVKR